jgi:hypothetical protein
LTNSGKPEHIGLVSRAFSPTKAVAFQLAQDLHTSGLVHDRDFLATRLTQLENYKPKLYRLVKSELRAYGDPLP